MHNKCILRNIEIKIYFHTSVMCMAWHCIPYTSRLKLSHTHFKLTCLNLSGKNILVDNSVVGLLKRSKLFLVFILDDNNAFRRSSFSLNKNCWICLMCRCAVDIKLSRLACIAACKRNIFCSHSDIHALLVIYIILFTIDGDNTCSTDIDNAHFTSL